VTARALAYWQFTPKMKLSLDVNNLFNKRYYSSSYSNVWIMPGDERAPPRWRSTSSSEWSAI
jgi:iron complex outermembrane receptor protein